MKEIMLLGTETGSVMNHLMSCAATFPKKGQGATVLKWTDRHAYEVLEVSPDGKRCIIQRYKPERVDNNGMGDAQDYIYNELIGDPIELRYKYGAWRQKSQAPGERPQWQVIHIIFGIKNEYYDFCF